MKRILISDLKPGDLFTLQLLRNDKNVRSIYRLVGPCSNCSTSLVEYYSFAIGVNFVSPTDLLVNGSRDIVVYELSNSSYVFVSNNLKSFQSIMSKGGVKNKNEK